MGVVQFKFTVYMAVIFGLLIAVVDDVFVLVVGVLELWGRGGYGIGGWVMGSKSKDVVVSWRIKYMKLCPSQHCAHVRTF